MDTLSSSPFRTSAANHNDISEINLYLVIANIAKKDNLRSLLLVASAFGCQSVLVVGQDKNLATVTRTRIRDNETNNDNGGGRGCNISNRNSTANENKRQPQQRFKTPVQRQIDAKRLSLERFAKWDQCVEYLETRNISLVGVEIDEASIVLDSHFFPNLIQRLQQRKQQQQKEHDPSLPHSSPSLKERRLDIAILMGNEGDGIHPKHMQACHAFVRIPQYGVGTASLNVNVAANIVLYRFHEWKRQWLLLQQQKQQELQDGVPK